MKKPKTPKMTKSTTPVTCAEEQIAAELHTLALACHYFGWQKPRDHIVAAQNELLMLCTAQDLKLEIMPCL